MERDDQYYKGYIAGYRDGIVDGFAGKRILPEGNVVDLPINAMQISARARNCLAAAGCSKVTDVFALSEQVISTMRNLGAKSAAEIAVWLDEHGICYSAWSKYL